LPDDIQSPYEAETARFREILAKGRSANQLALFDLLVERSLDQRSPKEIEIAIALFGNDATLETSSDSGVRVYVHRLRKRIDDHYLGKQGPRLIIPKGEYRIVLVQDDPTGPASGLPRWLAALSTMNPALGAGLLLIACAAIAFLSWSLLSPKPMQTPGKADNRQTLLGASAEPFNPLIVVGDSMMLAETQDHRSIQRMILNPEIRTRDDFGTYLKAHPETFYQLYDFGLNFAPFSAVEAAWAVQGKLYPPDGDRAEAGEVMPVSGLNNELLESSDIVFVGRLSQLGPLTLQVFSSSHFQLAAYDRLIDRTRGTVFQGEVYTADRSRVRKDFGYLSVRKSATGKRLIILAGLGDEAMTAVVALLTNPRELAQLRREVRGARQFEALFEVEIRIGAPLLRRLIAAHATS
jgi:hypothetical protein